EQINDCMKLLYVALCLLLGWNANAQKCNCPSELKFLEDETEHNLPSYYDQVVLSKRQAEYLKHKKDCDRIAVSLVDSSLCMYMLGRYLSFFRDEHLSVSYKKSILPFSLDGNDTVAMRIFFAQERKYPIRPMPLHPAGPEGYWQSRDN